MSNQPIVIISSYHPRLCGIGTFAEEAREFIQKANPDKDILVISHYDGEGEGDLLFTTKKLLKKKVVQLACDEKLRLKLGENLKKYLDNTVSWEIVAQQYNYAYELAREAKRTGKPVMLEKEF